jgi:hypothetical protein
MLDGHAGTAGTAPNRRGWLSMGAPDTNGIDLNPANFRDRADLVFCLEQLHTKIGGPSYRDLEKIGRSRGIELRRSTIGDLIGKKSKTSTRKLAWKTVELFVLACGVPEAELEGWRKAWEAAMAPDKPTWQEERQHLLATIDQLTTDLAAAKARIKQLSPPEPAAAQTRGDQPTAAVKEVEPLERLRIEAATRHEAKDYATAADLYKQIVTHVEREHGPGDPRTLQAQHQLLEIETEACTGNWLSGEWKFNIWFRVVTRRTLNARWRHLICEYQQCLSKGSRTVLELRLEHIYWSAVLLLEHTYWDATLFDEYDKRSTVMLPAARKLLISLHADCRTYLPPGDPFTAKVAQYVNSPEQLFHNRPERHQWEPESNEIFRHEV